MEQQQPVIDYPIEMIRFPAGEEVKVGSTFPVYNKFSGKQVFVFTRVDSITEGTYEGAPCQFVNGRGKRIE